MSQLKDETIRVAEEELVHFFPLRWKRHFLEWMGNVHDWTISRQLWWGQSIPVWWKPGIRGTDRENEPGAFIVSINKPEGVWESDPDVLDTWFSSAIWPLATLGWPAHTSDVRQLYPTSVLATAREILYLWVARMIFSGLELLKGEEYGNRSVEQRLPFRDVFIHPTVLTRDGKRMSKSLGTGIDPLALIDQYGADATRFGLMMQMSYDNQAIRFDTQAIVSARNFANKIWNIGRLLLERPETDEAGVAEEWIMERFNTVAASVTRLLQEYKFGEAARVLHSFLWDDFADWYLEILKIKGSTKVATTVFADTLKLVHPFMPHITEVLWKEFGHDELLIVSPWPHATPAKSTSDAAAVMSRVRDIVRTIRSARVLLGLTPASTLTVAVAEPPLPEITAALARVTLSEVAPDMKMFPLAAGGSLGIGGEHVTPEAVARAIAKLEEQLRQTQELVDHLAGTLSKMTGKAPRERIATTKTEHEKAQQRQREITKSLEALG
jgi:valyl-tRNA synthetase